MSCRADRVFVGFVFAAALVAAPGLARAEAPGGVRLLGGVRASAPAVGLLDRSLSLDGGGDGIVTGTARAAAFLVIGVGVGVGLVGAAFVEGSQVPTGKNETVGFTLIGAGALALVAGVLVLSGINCIACSTCGLADRTNGPATGPAAPREALAGREDRRPTGGTPLVGGWGGAF